MKSLSSAKPTVLMAAIFAISAAVISGCSSGNDTKATDRVDEAAAIARVQALEARATELKGKMPAATDGNAVKLPIILVKNYPIMWAINSTVPAVTWVTAQKRMRHLGTI